MRLLWFSPIKLLPCTFFRAVRFPPRPAPFPVRLPSLSLSPRPVIVGKAALAAIVGLYQPHIGRSLLPFQPWKLAKPLPVRIGYFISSQKKRCGTGALSKKRKERSKKQWRKWQSDKALPLPVHKSCKNWLWSFSSPMVLIPP